MPSVCVANEDGRLAVVGDFTVTQREHLDRFAGCEVIDGSLTILLDDACSFTDDDFAALSHLQRITGALTMRGQQLCTAGPHDLSALSSLREVESITIAGVGSLVAIELPEIAAGGVLHLVDMPLLETLSLPKVTATALELRHMLRLSTIDVSSSAAERVELVALGVGPTLNLAPVVNSLRVDGVPDALIMTSRIESATITNSAVTSPVAYIASLEAVNADLALYELTSMDRASITGGTFVMAELRAVNALNITDVADVQLPQAQQVQSLVLAGDIFTLDAPFSVNYRRFQVIGTQLTTLTINSPGSHVIVGNGARAREHDFDSYGVGDVMVLGNKQLQQATFHREATQKLVLVDNLDVDLNHAGGWQLHHVELEGAVLPGIACLTPIERFSVVASQVDVVSGDVLDFKAIRPAEFRLPLRLEAGEIHLGPPISGGEQLAAVTSVSATRLLDLKNVRLSTAPVVGALAQVTLENVTLPANTDLHLPTRGSIYLRDVGNVRSLTLGGPPPRDTGGEGEGEAESDSIAANTSIVVQGVDADVVTIDWTEAHDVSVGIGGSRLFQRVVFPRLTLVTDIFVDSFVGVFSVFEGLPIGIELPLLERIEVDGTDTSGCREPESFIAAAGSVFAPRLARAVVSTTFTPDCSVALVSSANDVVVTVADDFAFDLQGEGAEAVETSVLSIRP